MSNLDTIGGIHYEIMRRCYNPKCKLYPTFGGKGIKVYEPWHDREAFREWAKNNGWQKGLRLERINTSKDYTPDNCKFGYSSKRREDGKVKTYQRQVAERRRMRDEIGLVKHFDKIGITKHIYKSYHSMMQRCYNENNTAYRYYGGRGIGVCQEWRGKDGFVNFYKWSLENGYTEGYSIDRINSNGVYEPTNCRWADDYTQANNRRNTRWFVYKGERHTITEIAKDVGTTYGKLYARLVDKNMSVEDALADLCS